MLMPALQLTNFGIVCALIGLTFFLLIQSLYKKGQYHRRFLALFYFANLMNQIDELLWLNQAWRIYPWISNIYIPFLYILAPAFYLYTRSLTTNKTHSQSTWTNHFIGFFVALLACTPYFLLDQETKLNRLLAPTGSLEHLSYVTYAPKLALMLFIPFSLIYLVMILKILSAHLISIKAYFSNIENKDLSWLRWSIIILFIALFVSVLQLFLPSSTTEQPLQKLLFMVFEYSWITAISIFAIKQNIIIQPEKAKESLHPENYKTIQTIKYVRSQMSKSDLKRIEKKLIHIMEAEHLQRNPALTLRYLSDATKVSENRLSQVLNAQIGMGFYDFINSWRVKDACQMIEQTDYSLLDITYAVGFNSRSTFNAAFKKHTNETPSNFRKSHNVKN